MNVRNSTDVFISTYSYKQDNIQNYRQINIRESWRHKATIFLKKTLKYFIFKQKHNKFGKHALEVEVYMPLKAQQRSQDFRQIKPTYESQGGQLVPWKVPQHNLGVQHDTQESYLIKLHISKMIVTHSGILRTERKKKRKKIYTIQTQEKRNLVGGKGKATILD